MNVIVDSLAVSYVRLGTGKRALVLLHGWGDSQKTFASLAPELAKEYTVITVDMPGFGGTESPHKPWDLDAYAHFLQMFLKKIAVTPYALIGHSNGGSVAIKAVSGGMVVPEKLVLLAASGIRGQFVKRNKLLRIAAKVGKLFITPLPKGAKTRLRKRAYAALGSDMFVAEHLQETFKKVVSEDLLNQAKQITIPTLLIYGALDNATPPKFAELYGNAITNSEYSILQDAGHFVHHDQPLQVLEVVRKFL